ncbi:hypothetical protein KC332_g18181 [Hortaea werneckii]|uniref:DUF7918 domain-containing protein n=2 Tax=Hortaea werneckii TaxID=91943 RepID=A0A3M7IZJ1_HORWE|nr:hypothetical protein KC358_g18664 [Hortaea werneckii]OTA29498.1 hypothetical protein BTJ68_09359 [Hortaea werneckii EXF-2000]KAI6789002.1 hypothetical protein KC350_g18316 [Hortaea werneckii]KAI6842992.1 hypothetical protein KC342_g1253 [Hortaea werneckii]KAI6895517.1 hypothetical protein KC348_g18229 [Hortaea werneckii]
MAIHPNVPGLTVSIDVAGQDLPEYDGGDAQEASSATVVKYIEAISGAEFGIAFRFDNHVFPFADHAIAVSVFCDGNGASRKLFAPKTTVSGARNFIRDHVEERMNGDNVYRALMFSDLETSDADVNKGIFGKLKTLGMIVVKWHRGRVVPYRRRLAPPPFAGASLAGGRVPEKNLKGQAITHQTTYGRDVKRQGVPSFDVESIGEPFATFEFRYRSHAALQSIGLLPRSPSPIPLEDRNIDELNLEETRELLRRQQRQRESSEVAIKREIKRERIEFEDDDDDGDDIEIVNRPEKKPHLDVDDAGTEVVDLCGDD